MTHLEYEKKFLDKFPDLKLVSKFTSKGKSVFIQTEFGLCKIRADNALITYPTIKAAVDKHDYFVNKLTKFNKFFNVTFTLDSNYKGAKTHLILRNKFGLLKTTSVELLHDFNPTILSAINKDEYFRNKFYYDFPNTDISILGSYVGNNTPLLVDTKYGKCMSSPTHLSEGKYPSVRSAIDPTEYFVNKSNYIHNYKFTYENTIYLNDEDKVWITCLIHGDFEQTSTSHLQGIGCSKCGNLQSSERMKENPIGWIAEHWIKTSLTSNNFDSFKCYVIKCWNENEKFYKIGRTFKSLKLRFSGGSSMPYNYEVLKEIIFEDAYECCKKESNLNEDNKEYKYVPKKKFCGMFECFLQIKDLNLLIE